MRFIALARTRLQGLPVLARDGLFAALVGAADLSLLWLHDPLLAGVEGFAGPTPTAAAVVVALAAPLAWRRIAPHAVVAATLLGTVIAALWPVPTQFIPPIVALYTVAAYRPRAQGLPWLGVAATLAVVIVAHLGVYEALPGQLVIVLTAWLFGDRARVRRERDAVLEEQAADLERERERAVTLAASEERATVARELHDVLAHSVSLMVVQATAARRVLQRDPGRARSAVADVVATGEGSLAELQRMVGLLGAGESGPHPGLGDLPALIQGFSGTGLLVSLDVRGTPRPLGTTLELSAYRIVQESLTNVLKHAGADAAARVAVAHGDDALTIEVTDDGLGGATPHPGGRDAGGHGIDGMRERAAMLGGSLEAGPCPDGGFRVLARLPVDRS